MRLNPNFILRQVAGTWIVVPVGEKTINFNGMLTLNGSGCLLWTGLEQGADRESLVNMLTDKYDVSQAQALTDVDDFIAQLKKIGCVEE